MTQFVEEGILIRGGSESHRHEHRSDIPFMDVHAWFERFEQPSTTPQHSSARPNSDGENTLGFAEGFQQEKIRLAGQLFTSTGCVGGFEGVTNPCVLKVFAAVLGTTVHGECTQQTLQYKSRAPSQLRLFRPPCSWAAGSIISKTSGGPKAEHCRFSATVGRGWKTPALLTMDMTHIPPWAPPSWAICTHDLT